MKDPQFNIGLNQIASELEKEIQSETDVERNCRLQDAKELIRRAYHCLNGQSYEENDLITQIHK